jgi:hypothetical protein
MAYFAAALMFLITGGVLMASGFGYPSVVIDAPESLVVIHVMAIGWLGLLFSGALLQFVPVLVGVPLAGAWVAAPALVAVIAGLFCLVLGFLGLGGQLDSSLADLPIGAALVAAGFGALMISFGITLARARPLAVPAKMVAVGLGSLMVTVLLGAAFSTALSGVDGPAILYRLLPAGAPFHAAFGLLGWMTLTAIGVSYRLFTMFMLAPDGEKARGRVVFWLAVVGLAALIVSLCAELGDLPAYADIPVAAMTFTLAAVAFYARDIFRIYRARRRKVLELNTYASLVALGFLIVSLILLSASGFFAEPADLAAPAVYLLAMGWLTGLGLGQLYKIVPFLTWLECYGPVMGRVPVPRVQDLVNEKRAAWWFRLHYLAISLAGICLFFDAAAAFRVFAACQALAVAGLAFEYIQARRLSFAPAAVRLPKGATQPHLIFPQT